MRRLFIAALFVVMALSACSPIVSQDGLCDGTAALRTAHAAALAQDGGDLSVVSGARLIRALDAGCE